MPAIKLIVNGRTEFDGVLDEWSKVQPDFLKDKIKPGIEPKPWLKAVLIAFYDAVNQKEATTITARHTDGEWAVRVKTGATTPIRKEGES